MASNGYIGVVEGEITEVFWRNPHVRMRLQRTADYGQEEEWEIEFGSVNTIERIGITRDLLAVGDRTIHMNGAGSPSQPRMGRSVGRWEDRTLIVETRDIADWRYIDDVGAPQSEDALIDERFTLSEDGTDLSWSARITDPVNYSEPVIMEHAWTWLPDNSELAADYLSFAANRRVIQLQEVAPVTSPDIRRGIQALFTREISHRQRSRQAIHDLEIMAQIPGGHAPAIHYASGILLNVRIMAG
ncbi:MAG: hypothetical protein F4181_09550 [Proteobacteria bacterium]|nr:hypothetical protein [Pseudomonadota bacterium]